MKKDDVINFIENIKDSRNFLEYCKKFHENDPRDIAYVVSSNIVSRNPSNINFIFVGCEIIIITWNIARLQGLKSKVKINLENDILEAYKSSETKLKKLEGKGWNL